MTNHHDTFKALAPIDWNTIDQDNLKAFLSDTFGDAQSLLDSIPISLTSKAATQSNGRPRSSTDPTVPKLPGRAPQSSEHVEKLRKEWKEVQVNPRENPLGVNVYKLSAKDKKGAWFARRSVHDGVPFEKWKLGMESEFAESLKVQGKPGDGKIRGIGADRRVEEIVVDGCGKMEVYQLSAQFPGPTTPRDFVTLCLSSDSALKTPTEEGLAAPRYYMLVSKPCIHPECPQRNGYIRGQYESVEFIREIKVEKPLRKVRSSIDLSNEEVAAARQSAVEDLGKEALVRSARSAAMASSTSDTGVTDGRKRGRTISFAATENDNEEHETLVEWLMVTRSDPGGSVPRFMVEKGTPAGIAGDANKFVKWVETKKEPDSGEPGEADTELEKGTPHAEVVRQVKRLPSGHTTNLINDPSAEPIPISGEEQDLQPTGYYGMIAGAIAAAAAAASRLPNPFGSAKGGDTDSDLSPSGSTDGDASTLNSFHSLSSDHDGEEITSKAESNDLLATTTGNGESQSTHSSESAAGKSTAPSQHEKDLRKLEDKRRKLLEKMQRAQERAVSKKEQESQRDESSIAKLREKHDKEAAKQEDKYQRDLRKLEEKRRHEQKKAEERKRKAIEREEKANLGMELDKAKTERDVALKQIDILKEQVGELQRQNTMLVAKLGKQSSPALLADLKRTDSFKKSLEA
ncbi:hypothetical protein BJ170DRAFT_337918 [Xylariales sp. AK1849]|nr:hypothetical protein BJ170DRAFT_337918 [Xylariales sp. AK1849]